MDKIIKNQTDSQWAKAVAEARKEAMKTNKLFVAAMKESEKCFGEQFKIAKEYSKKFKEMFSGYYSVREFVTENLSGNPSKVKEKYDKLRKEQQNQQHKRKNILILLSDSSINVLVA